MGLNLHFKKMMLCTLLAFLPREAFSLSYQSVSVTQFSPSPLQKNLVESSGPIASSVLANDGSVWLLTTSTLWRWYPLTGVVQKINPGSDLNLSGANRALGARGDGVYVAIDGQLWRFGSGSGNVDRFAGAWDTSCKDLRFWGGGDFFGLSGDCGVWRVDRYGKTLRSMAIKSSVKSFRGSSVYHPTCKCLWTIEGRTLKRVTSAENFLKFEDHYEAKSSFIGITALDDHIVVWTSYALLVFDVESGKRQQVVPTSGSRRIVSAAFGQELHAILFHDGTIEWMVPKTKKAWTSRISPVDEMRLTLDPAGAFALVSTPGTMPLILNLEPFILTSP